MGLVLVLVAALAALVVLYVIAALVARVLVLDTGYYEGPRDLSNPPTIAIVTGTTSGVGKKTAEEFAADGAFVFLCDRDQARSQAVAQRISATTGNKNVESVFCDLADLHSVKGCAVQLLEKVANLRQKHDGQKKGDGKSTTEWRVILVNNAGVMAVPLSASEEGYEMQYAVNFLGHFVLTANLLPLLLDRTVADARVITLSSMAHRWLQTFDFDTLRVDKINPRTFKSRSFGYARSKLADVYLTRGLVGLAKKFPDCNMTAYTVDPGNVMTNLGRHMPLYFFILGAPILYLCQKTCCQGAQTTITCALSDKSELVNGGYYANRVREEPSDAAKDQALAVELWDTAIKQAAKFFTEETRRIFIQ